MREVQTSSRHRARRALRPGVVGFAPLAAPPLTRLLGQPLTPGMMVGRSTFVVWQTTIVSSRGPPVRRAEFGRVDRARDRADTGSVQNPIGAGGAHDRGSLSRGS
jgi:hypothetical protein